MTKQARRATRMWADSPGAMVVECHSKQFAGSGFQRHPVLVIDASPENVEAMVENGRQALRRRAVKIGLPIIQGEAYREQARAVLSAILGRLPT